MDKKDFKQNFLELRKLINSYELIPVAPEDEFDLLTHTLLSNLKRGANVEVIKGLLENVLKDYYKLSFDTKQTDKMAKEIVRLYEKGGIVEK